MLNKKTGAKTKGCFKKVEGGETFMFQFNPSTIKTKRGVNYSDFQGCGSAYPNYQYSGGKGETISFTLDIISNKDKVNESIKFMESLMPPKDTLAKFQKPPLFYFSFGSSFTEICVLMDLDKSHEEFDEELATTSVTYNIELGVIR